MPSETAKTSVGEESAGQAGDRCPVCGSLEWRTRQLAGHDRLMGTPGRHTVTVCAECGCGATRPFVPEDELGPLYESQDGYAPHVAGDRRQRRLLRRVAALFVESFTRWHTLRTRPISVLVDRPAGTLLDVGCGRGDLGGLFVQRGWRVLGIEPSPAACELARSRGIDVHEGTLTTFVDPESGIDAVVFQHSLEHVPAPREALGRARELLAPGGRIVVSVPNFGCWQRRVFRGRWFHLDLPRHRTHFTAQGLRKALVDVGFDEVETYTKTSAVGLVYSIHYAVFGRLPYGSGVVGQIVPLLALAFFPIAWVLDKLFLSGDFLHATALKHHDTP